MLANVVEQLLLPVVERGLGDAQLVRDLTFVEALCGQAEDLTSVGHDAVQILQQAGQHELVHDAILKGGALIRNVVAKFAVLGMVTPCVDNAVHAEYIAGKLVNAVAAVAGAFRVVVSAAAMITPGAVAFVRYPAGVVEVGLLRNGDQFLANGDVVLFLA